MERQKSQYPSAKFKIWLNDLLTPALSSKERGKRSLSQVNWSSQIHHADFR